MATARKKLCFSMALRLASFSAALLLFLPRIVLAGAAEAVSTVQDLKKTVVSTGSSDSQTLDFAIEQNGNLVFSCLNKSFTMARETLENAPALLEKVQSWKLQVEPAQSGFSVRVAYRF
jgi:hypothetical protein